MEPDKKDGDLKLKVSVRHVYSGEGKVLGEMRVFCPDRAHLVEIEECTTCPRWRGLYLEPSERESFVSCRPKNPKAATACSRDQIGAMMTSNVVCMQPELSVEAALDILLEKHIGAAPVIDKHGKLLGLVSRSDLLAVKNLALDTGDAARPSATIGTIMTPMVFSLCETASVATAARLMAMEGIHRLLVTSAQGELVGIVSALDVMRWMAEREEKVPAKGAP